ncbi:MAG: hypothetical protein J2P36_19710, partial [Ktedonobacteraceae bacterium]|nr:hypothetical protein [Ktedonobacteraceae bacterium]
YGEFLQTPVSGIGNVQSYSYLDHLRHLLVSDPALDDMELVGGLNNWLFRNTGKVLEWASSMREKWENTRDTGFVRHQTTSILTYLDGLSYIKQDLAPGTPLPSNERLARVGLICVNGPNQDPACYVAHVVNHLSGLLQTTQPTQEMREHVADLVSALNNVTFWMTQLRQDARQILKMNDQKLKQPATLSLINDMINNANHAYSGQNDPSIGEMRQGVVWAHEHMQALATMDIKPFVATNSSLQMVPNIRHARAGASGAEL